MSRHSDVTHKTENKVLTISGPVIVGQMRLIPTLKQVFKKKKKSKKHAIQTFTVLHATCKAYFIRSLSAMKNFCDIDVKLLLRSTNLMVITAR